MLQKTFEVSRIVKYKVYLHNPVVDNQKDYSRKRILY